MATEVSSQIRQNSVDLPDIKRNQQLEKETSSSRLVTEKRQDLQSTQQNSSLAQGNSTGENRVISEEKLDQTVEELSALVESLQRELNFSVDGDSGKTVIKVIDSQTEKLIRQIPSEEVVGLAELIDQHAGLLMNETV